MSTRASSREVLIRVASIAAPLSAMGGPAGERPAVAQQAVTLNGAPQQVIPYAPEPGAPSITISPGTPNPFAGASGLDTAANPGTAGSVAGGSAGPTPAGVAAVGGVGAGVTGPTSGAVSVAGSGGSLTYTNADGTTTSMSGGSMAWRDNNPGNIIAGPFATSQGAIGSNNGFAVFPDVATGTAALTTLLESSSYQSLSVDAAIAKYAPPSQNNTASYQATIETQLGVSGSTPLSALSSSQMQTLQAAIQRVEGYSAGSVTNQGA